MTHPDFFVFQAGRSRLTATEGILSLHCLEEQESVSSTELSLGPDSDEMSAYIAGGAELPIPTPSNSHVKVQKNSPIRIEPLIQLENASIY